MEDKEINLIDDLKKTFINRKISQGISVKDAENYWNDAIKSKIFADFNMEMEMLEMLDNLK